MRTSICLRAACFELIIHSIDRSGKYVRQHVQGLFPSLDDLRYHARNTLKIQNNLGLDTQGIVDEWLEQHRSRPGSKAFTWDDQRVYLKKGMTTSGNLEGPEVHIRRPRRKDAKKRRST
jgi:hypothetical protein